MEIINWINEWYNSQCDGDWEHEYGIEINTIDNPGWQVKIDITNTSMDGFECEYLLSEKSDDDWCGFSVKDNVFNGAGDPSKLGVLLTTFRELVERNNSN